MRDMQTVSAAHREFVDEHWLPRAPLAGNSKWGPYHRTKRDKALAMSYIEANPTCMQSLIITDHDGGNADEIPGLLDLPQPSWIALNPHTRGGHIVYVLGAPVCLTNAAHRRPVNLLARIETGLTKALGGDPGFAGRITKNPCHTDHLPLWGEATAVYGLKDLARALAAQGLLPAYDNHKATRISGVGRNVDLFNYLRKWAYPRRGSYGTGANNREEWEAVCLDRAMLRNEDHIGNEYARGPLSSAEVVHLSRSVSRWTWRNNAPVPTDVWLSQRQAQRGKKGGRKGGLRSGQTRRAQVEALFEVISNAN